MAIVWLADTDTDSSAPTVSVLSAPTEVERFEPVDSVRSTPTLEVLSLAIVSVRSCPTVLFQSLPAFMATCSLPAVSSNPNELFTAAPGDAKDFMMLTVAAPEAGPGGRFCPLYTRPVTIGLSGSPSRCSTMTSHPMRGCQSAP